MRLALPRLTHWSARNRCSAHQRMLPVLLGEHRARTLDRAAIVAMYVVVAIAVAVGAVTPFALLVLFAAPRALSAVRVMSVPAPDEPPAGYVGWPLWYHRVCLVHNRAFGWLYVLGSREVLFFQARGWARDIICI